MRTWQAHLAAAGGVAFLTLVSLWGVARTVDDVYTEQPVASAVVGELQGAAIAGQTFTAEYNGLSEIELYLATYARRNVGPLIFHLRAAPDATLDLVTITIDARDIIDNSYYTFDFPPIRASAGRRYYFFLEAPEATTGNAITIWGTKQDMYVGGEAVLNGLEERRVRDLTFRLRYELTLSEKISAFLDRLTANKPSLWGNRWLYIWLGVTYLALLYAMLTRMAERESRAR